MRALTMIAALWLTTLAASVIAAEPAAASEARGLIDADYIDQALLYQQRVSKARLPEHSVGARLNPGSLDPKLLRAFGAESAQRGLAQVERLAATTVDVRQERERISAAADRLAAMPADAPIDGLRAAYLELRWAIRAAVLKHPAWDVKELLFYTRRDGMVFPDVGMIHLPWVGSPGGDIHVLTPDPSGLTFGTVRPLLKGRLDPGHVRGFDLHFDAKRLIFGWTKGNLDFSSAPCRPGHDAFALMGSGWIHELDLDTGALRQITRGTAVHDAAPCYLPDERIAFMSDRSRSGVQCNQGQNEMFANLYACDAEGNRLERLNNNNNGDHNPRLLDDGRIAYMRWEYNERALQNKAFWAVRPDGTYAEPVFGQHVGNPEMYTDMRNIPGSRLLMLIVSQHYNYERGIIGVLDPAQGISNLQAIRPLLPWTKWIPGIGHPQRDWQGWFAEPWPLAEDLALCAYDFSPNQYEATGFGLYLADGSGNLELLYRDPRFSSHQPVPLRTRKRPPLLPRVCKQPPVEGPELSPVGYRNVAGDGTIILSDVTDGLELPAGVEPTYLRVSENLVLPYFTKAGQTMYPDLTCAIDENDAYTPKRIIGDVPIESDGSAHFRIPADRALYFQLLDRQGREIRRMRSWVSLQPGETRSCTGCHEVRGTTPRPQPVSLAVRKEAVTPQKRVSWGDKPVSFARDIRPILDRRCMDCHSGLKPAKDLDLRDPKSVKRLCKLAAIANRWTDHQITKVRQYGSAVAPIFTILANEKHAEAVKLTEQERIDLYAWVDLSAPRKDRCEPPYWYSAEGDVIEPEIKPWNPSSAIPGSPMGAACVVPPRKARIVDVSIDKKITAVYQKRCIQCHAKPELVLRPHWVDLQEPANTLFLKAPLTKAGGGTERCGGTVFADAQDADYQSILTALQATVREAWQNPDADRMSLIEAGRVPAWVNAAAPKPLPTDTKLVSAAGPKSLPMERKWVELVRDTFDSQKAGDVPAGWTLDTAAGAISVQNVPASTNKCAMISDSSATAGSSMSRSFAAQSGKIRVEMSVRQEAKNHGMEMMLNNAAVVRFHSNGELRWIDAAGEHSLQAFTPGVFYRVRIEADIPAGVFDVYVDNEAKA
ncbi:MAG: hypothetical protein ACOYOU_12775, partial [Kiritimatiellia bacterium]